MKSLAERIETLAGDERAIVETVVERIEQGRRAYGPWNIADGRVYEREALEEILDGMAYLAAELVRLRGAQ